MAIAPVSNAMLNNSDYSHLSKGFTLVELIIVVVLVGVLSVLGGRLILYPIQGFVDVARRAELVDIGDNALHRMSRELRNALPNSVRINTSGSRTSVEFLNTSTGGRYRAKFESGGGGDPLTNGNTDTFDVLDGINLTISPGSAGQANCFSGSADCLVIYNTGTIAGSFNAYNGDNIAAITAVDTINNRITYNNGGAWSFPFSIPPSSQQRFFVVDMPISFVCDMATGELLRYANYTISAAQPVSAASFGVAGNLLANKIAACQFTYNTGAGARHGLVTLRIAITDMPSSETISLLHQVHVINAP